MIVLEKYLTSLKSHNQFGLIIFIMAFMIIRLPY